MSTVPISSAESSPVQHDEAEAVLSSCDDESITYSNIMVDIETMSLHKHNALILSIGMIQFHHDRDGVKIGRHRLILPDLADQLALGREVSADTQKFWRDQSAEARDHWVTPGPLGRTALPVACHIVRDFCEGHNRVWAQGNQFDLANIEGLADQVGEKDLWHYRAPRDARTFCAENSTVRSLENSKWPIVTKVVPHHPISDAITQAVRVWECYRYD